MALGGLIDLVTSADASSTSSGLSTTTSDAKSTSKQTTRNRPLLVQADKYGQATEYYVCPSRQKAFASVDENASAAYRRLMLCVTSNTDGSDDGGKLIICRLPHSDHTRPCDKLMKLDASNVRAHLRDSHFLSPADDFTTETATQAQAKHLALEEKNEKKWLTLVFAFLLKGVSYTMITSKSLRETFASVGYPRILPERETFRAIAKDIAKQLDTAINRHIEMAKEKGTFFSLLTDSTSQPTTTSKHLVSVRLAYILMPTDHAEQAEYVNDCICIGELPESSAFVSATIISKNMINKYGLAFGNGVGKIGHVGTDGASSATKIAHLLGAASVVCCSHRANLALQSAAKSASVIQEVEVIHQYANKIRSSTIVAKEFEKAGGRRPCVPVTTRWSTNTNLVKWFLQNFDAIKVISHLNPSLPRDLLVKVELHKAFLAVLQTVNNFIDFTQRNEPLQALSVPIRATLLIYALETGTVEATWKTDSETVHNIKFGAPNPLPEEAKKFALAVAAQLRRRCFFNVSTKLQAPTGPPGSRELKGDLLDLDVVSMAFGLGSITQDFKFIKALVPLQGSRDVGLVGAEMASRRQASLTSLIAFRDKVQPGWHEALLASAPPSMSTDGGPEPPGWTFFSFAPTASTDLTGPKTAPSKDDAIKASIAKLQARETELEVFKGLIGAQACPDGLVVLKKWLKAASDIKEPWLTKAICAVAGVPMSTASNERDFSRVFRVFTEGRTRLKTDMLGYYCMAALNAKYFDANAVVRSVRARREGKAKNGATGTSCKPTSTPTTKPGSITAYLEAGPKRQKPAEDDKAAAEEEGDDDLRFLLNVTMAEIEESEAAWNADGPSDGAGDEEERVEMATGIAPDDESLDEAAEELGLFDGSFEV
jgi:hypothetical protein